MKPIKRKRFVITLMLLASLLLLSGCRVRTTAPRHTAEGSLASALSGSTASGQEGTGSGSMGAAELIEADDDGSPLTRTTASPDAQRREYDENASAEVVPGAEHVIHTEGESTGSSMQSDDALSPSDKLNVKSDRRATQVVPADEADRLGTSEEAQSADTFLIYYSVLLQEHADSLFECHRKDLYLELPQELHTVHKTSPEHQLILRAGCYDVSARLLPENLTVDPGWVCRKNPGVIVKFVDSDILGRGVVGTSLAEAAGTALISREGWHDIDAVKNGRVLLLSSQLLESRHLQTAAALCIAKASDPEAFADTDLDQALKELSQEESGAPADGVFFYLLK